MTNDLTLSAKISYSSSLMDLAGILRCGIGAAYKGAEIIRNYYGRPIRIDKKSAIDLVTEADIGAEKAIIKSIRQKFPDHAILAEESGLDQSGSDYQWIIDPLDGTTNFAHQVGLFAISIAWARSGKIEAGIVLNPINGELFTATSNDASQCNGRPVSVSQSTAVSESLLVTGFPYDLHSKIDQLMNRFVGCLRASRGVRRLGCAALDLCYVACGRFDGFWEEDLNPWDTAAGMLICQQAGGTVTDFQNRPYAAGQKEILATNGLIHREMVEILEAKVSK